MQDLGIRYYMAFRPEVIAQADANPDLTSLRQVGPWTIYEVADSDLVVPLTTNPVVVKGGQLGAADPLGREREAGSSSGTSWFQHPEDWAALPAAERAGGLAAHRRPRWTVADRPMTGTWPGSSRPRRIEQSHAASRRR